MAALFRSVARRSMTSTAPRAASGALSPRQIFHGGLHRRLDLLPPAVAPARLFSSASTPGSPIRNPLPCDGNKKAVPASPDSRDRELPMRELEKKIVEKQGELLRLLLQWDVARRPSSSGSDTCVEKEEQLLHRRRECQAKTQREEAQADPVANFVFFIVIMAIFRCIIVSIFHATDGE